MANVMYEPGSRVRDWLARRKNGIGSSDAAAVCGLDPYKTALEVYLSKTDESDPAGDMPTDPALRWGLLLEEPMARAYELDTGCTLIEPPPAVHPSLAWMLATADRMRDDGRIVELKTASSRAAGWGEPGDPNGIPERVAVQVAHQLAVYGADSADVACLIDGRDWRIYPVTRDDESIDCLIRIELEFWGRIERREPPEPDWDHSSTPELLNRLYKPCSGKEVSLSDRFADLAREYLEWGDDIAVAEAHREKIKAQFIDNMEDAAIAHVGGYTIDRREIVVHDKAREARTRSYVRFLVKQPKSVSVS